MLRGERKIMDRDFGLHYHNYIEYRAPGPNKVKYAPPSPTTSGYSESSCEMDNPDSGRVSEMENSPKFQHQRRPNNISLTMGIFNPGEGQMSSPDPFPEGKSTIKMNENIEQRRLQTSGVDLNANDCVLVNVKTLRTLVLSLRQAQSRLDTVETKIDHIVKAIQIQHNSSQKLSKTIVALGNDLKSNGAQHPENGRVQMKKFQSPSASVPLSCNNNNIARTPYSTGNTKKFQSSECISSSELTPLPPKSSHHSDYQTATFPRFLRSDAAFLSPLSVATPSDKEPENYDNVDVEGKSEIVSEPGAKVAETKSPLYAVVRKKNKSKEHLNAATENPPILPRRSLDMMVPLVVEENIQRGPSVEDLDELIKEITDSEITSSISETFQGGSLTRTSRFSDVEDLMAVFDNSLVFSDNKLTGNESPDTWQEEYDNKNSNTNLNSEVKNEQPFREGDRSAGSVLCSSLTDINDRERFLEPVSKNGQTWHDLDDATFQSVPNTRETTFSKQNGDIAHSDISHSVREHAASHSQSHTSLISQGSRSTVSNSDKKSVADSKKGNVLRYFKRKNRKPKRSISQNSFTFVNSPLYESEINQRVAVLESPNTYGRGTSVDSIGNERDNSIDVTVVSSLSTLSSSHSHDDNVFLGNNRFSSDSIDRKKLSDDFLSSPSSSQLLRLQSKEEDDKSEFDNYSLQDLEEHYDNTSIDQEEDDNEMRPNLIKLAKQAFRNSPKLRKKSKTLNGNVHTAEIKKLVPNGHVAKISTPVLPPKVPEKQKSKTESTNDDRVSDDNIGEDVFIPPGVILDKQQREQADRLRFDSDNTSSSDKPPPKPNRPGFSHGGSPRSSVNAHGASNGSVPGYSRSMPVVPPKAKIMTPEELTAHEAQEKLRLKQMEDKMLQQTLNQQQRQARENAVWLKQEEHMLNPDNVAANGGKGSSNSLADVPRTMEAPPPPNVAPSKPPRKGSRPKEEPAGPPQTKLEEVKTAPTMQLNRDDDHVYKDTMEVVKSVLSMNNMTMNAKPDELFASVKTVGAALKQLCTSLEKTLPSLPEDFHREIDMAQKTTNKDLSQVINQLKLVQRFFTTTQVVDYKKCLMAANQVLAIDAKNLLDVVDRARIRKIQTAQENQNRMGASGGMERENSFPDGDFL